MKLHLNLTLRRALLACLFVSAAFESVAVAGDSFMVDGIDAESILQSERFYDVGKGYYWSNYNIISAANSLYSSQL